MFRMTCLVCMWLFGVATAHAIQPKRSPPPAGPSPEFHMRTSPSPESGGMPPQGWPGNQPGMPPMQVIHEAEGGDSMAPGGMDLRKPMLTDDLVNKLIKSFEAQDNPMRAMMQANQDFDPAAMQRVDAFARKHGFKDGNHYMEVVGRVMVGMSMMAGGGEMEDPIKGLEREIKEAEAALKDPEMDKESRKELASEIKEMRQELARMKKGEVDPAQEMGMLNKADQTVLKKHKDRLQKAMMMLQQ